MSIAYQKEAYRLFRSAWAELGDPKSASDESWAAMTIAAKDFFRKIDATTRKDLNQRQKGAVQDLNHPLRALHEYYVERKRRYDLTDRALEKRRKRDRNRSHGARRQEQIRKAHENQSEKRKRARKEVDHDV